MTELLFASSGTSLAGKNDAARIAGNRATNVNTKSIMNVHTVKGNWNITKGRLKQKFANLTDDELQFVEGKEDELIGRIQKRTGQARENIKRAVDECCGFNH